MLNKIIDAAKSLAFVGAAAVTATALVAPAPAFATEEVYIAKDYNDGAANHGFWSNPNNNGVIGVTNPYFSFDGDGVIFTLDEMADYASLVGWASNGTVSAYLDILFTGFSSTLPGGKTYKAGGGPYSDANVDFFTQVDGTITINGVVYDVDSFAGSTLFQYGLGATDKKPIEYGGSAWLMLSKDGQKLSNHVDLNFALTPAVPEPSTWMMLLLGFFGIGLTLRRARSQENLAVMAS